MPPSARARQVRRRLRDHWAPPFLQRHARSLGGQPATLGQRQVFILPTRYGLLFAGLMIVMLVGSLNYGSNLGFLFTFLLTGIALASLLETWRNLLGLQVVGTRAEPVFAGQDAWFCIELGNPRGSLRPGIELSRSDDSPLLTDLSAHERRILRLRTPTAQRGQLELGRLTLATRYPLGLFRAWGYVELPLHCIVYPRPADVSELPPAPGDGTQSQGIRGKGTNDFSGLRPYRPGDSLKHVYWKALARGGEALTKEFGGDQSQQIWLDWSELTERDTEIRLSLLCRWVLLANEAGLNYGLRLPDMEIPPRQDDQQRHRCLAALARFGGPP